MKQIYLFAALMGTMYASMGQTAPGGVSTNLKVWIHAGSGTSTTTNGATLTNWTYVNDATKAFFDSLSAAPTYNVNLINFKPAIHFSGGQILCGPSGTKAPIAKGKPDYCMFAVWRSSSVSTFQRVWEQKAVPNVDTMGFALATWNNGHYGDQTEIPPYGHTFPAAYTAGTWQITQLNVLNQPLNDLEVVNDANFSGSPLLVNTDPNNTNGPAHRFIDTSGNRLGARDLANNEALTGDIAEVIVFDRPISGAERSQIFSYLALKYGFTLNTDLVSSGGSAIWSNTTNTGYTNAVFGIGLDNGSGFSTNQGNSLVTGNGDGTGQSGKGNIVINNPSTLTTDKNFLFIGNDNGGFAQSPSVFTGADRFAQRWKVQHTGNVGTVDLHFDLTGITNSGTIGNIGTYKLEIDQDGDGNFATGTQTFIPPTSFSGNVANFTGVTLNNGVVFTVLSSATPLPVTWRDFTATLAGSVVNLHWLIDENATGKVFEVQESIDGKSFNKVGEVANDPNVKSYSYAYTPLTGGTHYFRIHEIDIDGRDTYSKIVALDIKASGVSIRLLNNPTRDNSAQLEVNAAIAGNLYIEVWSTGGTRISAMQKAVSSGLNRFPVPLDNAPAGNYILKITSGAVTTTEKLIKL